MRGIRLVHFGLLLVVLAAVILAGCTGTKANDDRTGTPNTNPNNGGYTMEPNQGGNVNPGQGGANNNNFVPPQAPQVDDYVQQGAKFSYDGYSAFVRLVNGNKEYSSPAHTRWDVTINEVTADSISYNVDSYLAEHPELQHTPITHTWTYGDNYDFCVWVDPNDPESTVVAPVGMAYTLQVVQPYTLKTNGHNYPKAGLLVAAIPDTGTTYSITYDTETGIVLAQSYVCPSEEVYLYLI